MTNTNRMWIIIRTTGICLLLLTLASSCRTLGGSQARAGTYELVVNGNHSFWTEYPDILLEPGDKVVFDATGKIMWDPALPSEREVGPEGASWTPSRVTGPEQFLLVDFPIAALIGKVGDAIFGIGKHAEVTIEHRGVLRLGMNERWLRGCWDDNTGAFRVHVTLK